MDPPKARGSEGVPRQGLATREVARCVLACAQDLEVARASGRPHLCGLEAGGAEPPPACQLEPEAGGPSRPIRESLAVRQHLRACTLHSLGDELDLVRLTGGGRGCLQGSFREPLDEQRMRRLQGTDGRERAGPECTEGIGCLPVPGALIATVLIARNSEASAAASAEIVEGLLSAEDGTGLASKLLRRKRSTAGWGDGIGRDVVQNLELRQEIEHRLAWKTATTTTNRIANHGKLPELRAQFQHCHLLGVTDRVPLDVQDLKALEPS
mmetsp:Transcript_31687/g.67355  ORF Transcript_31687/g.67355 Transcript_31687/m.67355 type:complete len:268 (+) Transcript_31687:263-1066(+)